jgi:heme exporter protein B
MKAEPAPASLRRALAAVVARDLRLSLRRRIDALIGLVFFVLVASLFPLAVGAEPRLLREIGPGVLWVSALLASLLSLHRLFVEDHADGTLEQCVLMPHPLSVLVLGKVFAHWLTSGLPLVMMTPLLGLQFGLEAPAIGTLMLSLALGTPVLSLLGALGAALSLGLRGGGALTALLVLPLNVPVLIFGTGTVGQQLAGLDPSPTLSLLGALLALGLATLPWAIATALRTACD